MTTTMEVEHYEPGKHKYLRDPRALLKETFHLCPYDESVVWCETDALQGVPVERLVAFFDLLSDLVAEMAGRVEILLL